MVRQGMTEQRQIVKTLTAKGWKNNSVFKRLFDTAKIELGIRHIDEVEHPLVNRWYTPADAQRIIDWFDQHQP